MGWSSSSRPPSTAAGPRSRERRSSGCRTRTQASGTDWALGLEARSQALLTDGAAAGALYEEAIARLARAGVAPYLARAQLVYGEWLRREQRRREAREQLREAHDAFVPPRGRAWAERARRELRRDGRDRAQALAWRRATS